VEVSIYRGYLYEVGFKTPLHKDPSLTATPTELTFECEATETDTNSFTVKGSNLTGNVTLTLNDANNVFSIDTESIIPSNKAVDKAVNVTFSPQEEGTYTGAITVTSAGVEPITINLSGTAKKHYPESFDVTISAYGVSTLYLDYPVVIPYDEYDDLLGVYFAKEVTGKEIKLVRLEDYVPANQGVVIQGNSGTYTFPRYRGEVVFNRENLLTGVTETTNVSTILADEPSGSVVMTLGKGTNGYIGFYKFNGKTLGANKAFIIYSREQSAKSLSMTFEDENATGIRTIDQAVDNNYWYTLEGVRIEGLPSKSGIYVHNGKTVVIKK
jgi:hypothetical protein